MFGCLDAGEGPGAGPSAVDEVDGRPEPAQSPATRRFARRAPPGSNPRRGPLSRRLCPRRTQP
jgi:hypothetical protein